MKKILIMLGASLMFSACGMTGAKTGKDGLSVGDTVVYKSSKIGYKEGKIEKNENGKLEIRSGNRIDKKDASEVYALPKSGAKADFKVGDIVVAFSRELYWEGGEVKGQSGDVVEVQRVTGSKLNVAPDKVFKPSAAAIADIKQEIAARVFVKTGEAKKAVIPDGWKPKKGDKVVAQWGLGSWYLAVIKNVNEKDVEIDWQNAWSDDTIPLDRIAPLPNADSPMPKVDDYIALKPDSDSGKWDFAVVTKVSDSEVEVKLEDGKTKNVKKTEFISLS